MAALVHSLETEQGATMVEQAIVLPLFVLITFVIIDLCYISFHALSLQFAVSKAIRTISIERTANATDARNAIANAFTQSGVTLLPTDQITLCPVVVSGPPCPENTIVTGDLRELMVLRIRRPTRSLFAGFLPSFINITAKAVGRNEPN